jgi:uncharacterized membrane protein
MAFLGEPLPSEGQSSTGPAQPWVFLVSHAANGSPRYISSVCGRAPLVFCSCFMYSPQMIVPLVLFGSLILFRLLGLLGVQLFSTWHESTAYALAVMFCFTGVAHFGRMRAELENMVPPWVPNPQLAVFVTGVLEIVGAIGLILPKTRWLAGICLIAFLVAVFPANIHAAKTDLKLGDRPVTPLWIRGPMQAAFILLIAWTINP